MTTPIPTLANIIFAIMLWVSVVGIASYYVAEFNAPTESYHDRERRLAKQGWLLRLSRHTQGFITSFSILMIGSGVIIFMLSRFGA